MVRCLCSGLTRGGARCKITSDSKVKDKHGRLASLPLQLGGQFCLFHARVLHELALPDGRVDFALFYIDLETDGLDVFRDNIVEIAALSAGGAPFSSLVVPPRGRLFSSAEHSGAWHKRRRVANRASFRTVFRAFC